jgi:hypothetical protein
MLAACGDAQVLRRIRGDAGKSRGHAPSVNQLHRLRSTVDLGTVGTRAFAASIAAMTVSNLSMSGMRFHSQRLVISLLHCANCDRMQSDDHKQRTNQHLQPLRCGFLLLPVNNRKFIGIFQPWVEEVIVGTSHPFHPGETMLQRTRRGQPIPHHKKPGAVARPGLSA